jgi:hypothetical protein
MNFEARVNLDSEYSRITQFLIDDRNLATYHLVKKTGKETINWSAIGSVSLGKTAEFAEFLRLCLSWVETDTRRRAGNGK